MKTINKGNSVFTNVALTEDGDIWWRAWRTRRPAPPRGRAVSDAERRRLQPPQLALLHADQTVRHPRARSTTTRAVCRSTRSSSAAVARRPSRSSSRPATGRTAPSSARRSPPRPPPPRSARSASSAVTRWRCCPSSATTPGDYFNHWITVGKDNDAAAPEDLLRQLVPADDSGDFLWPGFRENSQVLKWVVERIDGQAAAVETPIGHVPRRAPWTPRAST